MKHCRFFSVVVLILFAIPVFCSGNDYNFIIFGDTHYSFAEAHDLDALSPRRKVEVKRNLNFWSKTAGNLFDLAVSTRDAQTIAVLQAGDLIQGDGKDADAQTQLITGAIKTFKDKFSDLPFYFTKGNHDIRVGKAQWNTFDTIFPEYLKKLPGSSDHKKSNCIVDLGRDAIIIFDSFYRPDHQWAIDAIEKMHNKRYIFLLTHYPMVGTAKYYGYYHPELQQKIMQRNVIIICGHIHQTGVAGNGRSFTQLTASSISAAIAPMELRLSDYDTFRKSRKDGKLIAELDRLFPDGMENFTLYRGAGFVKLQVSQEKITATIFDAVAQKQVAVWQLYPQIKQLN